MSYKFFELPGTPGNPNKLCALSVGLSESGTLLDFEGLRAGCNCCRCQSEEDRDETRNGMPLSSKKLPAGNPIPV